jgi:hypothetical protein
VQPAKLIEFIRQNDRKKHPIGINAIPSLTLMLGLFAPLDQAVKAFAIDQSL